MTERLTYRNIEKPIGYLIASTHFNHGHCNLAQCLRKLPLSERACAADDKHSAKTSALSSILMAQFKIALSCNQAEAFASFFILLINLQYKNKQREKH